MFNSDNPYLVGNYAPWREEGDEQDLLVDGQIPKDLNGALYRIGPNPHYPPLGPYHWFDGDGMVHAFLIRDGRASYRNRYVRTDGLKAEIKAGKALFGGLLNMGKSVSAEGFKNAANTNVIGFAQRLLALWEGGLPHELTPQTLETAGLYDFGGKLNGPMTAHPKFDPVNGDLLFFGYQPIPPYVTYHRADASGCLLESKPVDTGLPVMMHDFIATEHHAVFFVCPIVFRIENIPRGKPALVWEPRHGTRIGVMNRKAFDVRWFQAEAFHVFHFVNAYEENGSVVVDGCRMESLDMTGTSFGNNPALPFRWTLDMKSGTVKSAQFDEYSSEFPRFDERLAGFKNRYGYYAGNRAGSRGFGFNVLIKRDFEKGSTEIADLGAEMTPGEPIFVPRSAGAAEDDGWVLAVWYDARENRSELSVIDSRDFSGKPVARIKVQHRVPYGFHGNWIGA